MIVSGEPVCKHFETAHLVALYDIKTDNAAIESPSVAHLECCYYMLGM